MTSLDKASEIVLNKCMGVKKTDSVLIIFDKEKLEISDSIYNKGIELGLNVNKFEIPIGKTHGEEPPIEAADEMLKHNVIILITTKSLSHTHARRNAISKGARCASMPTITSDIMSRLDVDFEKMNNRGKKILSALKGKKQIRITTELGTNITMNIEGRVIYIDSGIYHNNYDFGNLPAGEVEMSPVEGSTNGKLIVDATMAGIGKLKSPLTWIVKDGYIVDIQGEQAEQLRKIIDGIDEATNIAELGIGINDKAILTGNILEDEKIFGTIHMAMGDNMTYKGNVYSKVHLDGVVTKPTLYVDGLKIIDKGNLLI